MKWKQNDVHYTFHHNIYRQEKEKKGNKQIIVNNENNNKASTEENSCGSSCWYVVAHALRPLYAEVGQENMTGIVASGITGDHNTAPSGISGEKRIPGTGKHVR